jgi:hypothetical protein
LQDLVKRENSIEQSTGMAINSSTEDSTDRPVFDPEGLFLSAVVSAGAFILLLKGAWFSPLFFGLAGIGMFFSHRRFETK